MNTTTVSTAVQRRWACHARTVLSADAYGRHCCNVVLSACSVVYLWCISLAVCSCERAKTDCARERGQQKQTILPVRTYKIGLTQRNPGNHLIHSPRKKTLRARHASYSARIELKPQPQVPDGLPVSTRIAFWLKVLVRRDKFENRRKFHRYTYTYKAPLRGVGCSPRGDASWHATRENYQSPSSGTPRSMRVIPDERNI